MTDDNPRVRAAVEAVRVEMERIRASQVPPVADDRVLALLTVALRAYDDAQCRHDSKWVCANCDNRSDIYVVNGKEMPR